jgi:ferric-dicitrate binding protein FerR (iron transport regulator)
MSVSALSRAISYGLLCVMPLTLLADTNGAMVYGKGVVWLNGNPMPDSSAIMPGDQIETKTGSVATINANGSNVIVQAESTIKFDAQSISLEQGSVSVATSQQLIVHAANSTVAPGSAAWTEFEVTNLNGNVAIIADKGSLNVNCGKEETTLAEGQQLASEPSGKCGKREKKSGAYPPASGNLLSSPYLKYAAAAAGGGVLIWLLWPKSHQPASPAIP